MPKDTDYKGKDKKKKIMRAFKMDEISAVDNPAQIGARMTIMKRAEDVVKRARLTSSDDDHAHLIEDDNSVENGGETSYQSSGDKDDYGHTHPWVMNMDGSITIGEAKGHTHTVLDKFFPISTKEKGLQDSTVHGINKGRSKEDPPQPQGDNSMPKEKTDLEKAQEAHDAKTAELEARLLKSDALGSMNDSQREYYGALEEKAQEAFLTKSSEARDLEMGELEKADPVVFTAADGTQYRKSADAALVSLAKRADAADIAIQKANDVAENAEFEKRAVTELPNLPGTDAEKAAMLKAIASIEDEDVRKANLASLHAGNAAMAKNFDELGSQGSPVAKSANDQLAEMAKAHATENKITFEKAYDVISQTPEGAELYKQTLN